MRNFRFATCGLFVAATASLVTAQTDDVARLIHAGKTQNQSFQIISHLSNKIGARLTGSPALARGQKWAVEQFTKWGLKNVHLEQWGEVPVGFERGQRQVARMTSPWKTEFVFSTPAWTPGTKGLVKAKPIMQPESLEEIKALGGKLKGAWIVMRGSSGVRGPNNPDAAINKALEDAGIAGMITASADERVHTGGRFTGLTMDNLPKVVQVRVRKSDMETITTGIKAGRDVELEFDIDNRFIAGPVPQFNVIADIPGTEKPDEMVIVCGHFDSWNGPGSQGTNDNGTGSTVTLEAARLMASTGVKPKRTVRFILWSGEEQGLLGSRAYVEKHKADMPKVSAVFNDDGGTNYQGGYNCLESMVPMLKAAMAPVEAAFPDLPMKLNVIKEMPRGGSSDHAPFVWEGVPGFFTMESGRSDYGYVWHTQNDHLINAIPEYLVQSSTNAAVVALNIANAPSMLPKPPKPEGGIGGFRTLPAGGSRNYYHDHSHDDDHDHTDDWVDYVVDRLLRRLGILR